MRYAIVSDIHANRTALRAVEQVVQRLRREDEVAYWFLGDLVGYGPAEEAVDCVRWLRLESGIPFDQETDLGQRWVPGNHDEWLVSPGEQLHADAEVTLRCQLRQLMQPAHLPEFNWFTRCVKAALYRLPKPDEHNILDDETRSLVIENHPALSLAFVHASVLPATRRLTYLFPWQQFLIAQDLRRLQSQTAGTAPVLCLFHGHTHFPALARLAPDGHGVEFQSIRYGQPLPLAAGCYAINPGSVGQPRDGDLRAAFAILDTEAGTVEFRRVEYDVAAVVRKLNWESNQARRADQGAYQSLVNRLLTADGAENLQHYRSIYRAPDWDLKVVVPS